LDGFPVLFRSFFLMMRSGLGIVALKAWLFLKGFLIQFRSNKSDPTDHLRLYNSKKTFVAAESIRSIPKENYCRRYFSNLSTILSPAMTFQEFWFHTWDWRVACNLKNDLGLCIRDGRDWSDSFLFLLSILHQLISLRSEFVWTVKTEARFFFGCPGSFFIKSWQFNAKLAKCQKQRVFADCSPVGSQNLVENSDMTKDRIWENLLCSPRRCWSQRIPSRELFLQFT